MYFYSELNTTNKDLVTKILEIEKIKVLPEFTKIREIQENFFYDAAYMYIITKRLQ